MPTFFYDRYVFIRIDVPSEVYGKLMFADINIADVFMLLVLFYMLARYRTVRVTNGLLITTLVSIFGFALLFLNGYDVFVYIDSFVYLARCIVFFVITSYIFSEKNNISYVVKHLLIISVIIALVSVMAHYYMGYVDVNRWGQVVEGRVNALGMGVNQAAEFFAMIFLIVFSSIVSEDKDSFIVKNNPRLFLATVMLLSIIMVLISGSRRVLVLLIAFVLLVYFLKHKGIRFRYVLLWTLLVFSVLYYVVDLGSVIWVLQRFSDNVTIDRITKFLINAEMGLDIYELDGRYDMYNSVVAVLKENSFGVGNSTWAIQDQIGKHGFGSHAHNIILQFYLMYGVFFIFLGYWPYMAIRKRSMHTFIKYPFVFFFVSQMFGYSLWNLKIMFFIILMCVLIESNDHSYEE